MEAPAETGARARTRSAILRAAASALAHNRAATLPDIAEAAGVGRTTLHRYFADRETLLRATVHNSVRVLQQSMVDADTRHGPAHEALRRVVGAMVAAGDHLLFLFGDPRALAGTTGAGWPTDDPVYELIERGQADGTFDSGVSARWIQHSLWALVYRGYEDADRGELPLHGVAPTVIRTLENGIRTTSRT
jgi:AcrR family transcriptional regulator